MKSNNFILATLMDRKGETFVRLVPEDMALGSIMYVDSGRSWHQAWITRRLTRDVTIHKLRECPTISEALTPGAYQKKRKPHKRE